MIGQLTLRQIFTASGWLLWNSLMAGKQVIIQKVLQSIMKVENAGFSVHVWGSEYVQLPVSNDPSYLLLVPDSEI